MLNRFIHSITLLLILGAVSSLFSQVAVITHKDVGTEEISKTELFDFYTGDIQKWKDGESVIVFDLKSKGEIKKRFYDYMGTTTSRMKSIWLKKMLAGEKDPPQSVETEADMIEIIAKTPGAIGFVSRENVTDDVKIILTIEKSN